MLKATIQRILRSAIMPISRKYRADRMFEWPRIKGRIFTNTLAGRYKSLDGNRYAQVFSNYYFFADAYPMEKKSLAGQGLGEFIANFGVMERLVCHGSKEQTAKGGNFMKEVRKHGIDLQVTDPDCHNHSKVEVVIKEMQKKWFRFMLRKKVPHRLRGYGLKWVAEIIQRNVGSAGSLNYLTSL